MKRRDSTRVIHDILLLAEEGVPKTQIVYRANLNFRLVKSYLDFLTSNGYVSRRESGGTSSDIYELTDLGKRLLTELQELEGHLGSFFPAKLKRKAASP